MGWESALKPAGVWPDLGTLAGLTAHKLRNPFHNGPKPKSLYSIVSLTELDSATEECFPSALVYPLAQ